MATVTHEEIDGAVNVLARSSRGMDVMEATLAMLDGGGISLDESGQFALMTLLTAAFTSSPGYARDAMRKTVTA